MGIGSKIDFRAYTQYIVCRIAKNREQTTIYSGLVKVYSFLYHNLVEMSIYKCFRICYYNIARRGYLAEYIIILEVIKND